MMIKTLIILFLTAGEFILAAPARDSTFIVKDPNSERYLVTVNPNDVPAKIAFGERQKFVPKFEGSKWGGEVWLTVEHADKNLITTQKPSLTDGKLQLTVGDRAHRYYIDPNGRIEYEIEFATKPASNIVILELDFPEGLKFYYQDTLVNEWKKNPEDLTLKEYLAMNIRPENVEGSYAVYWKKRNNQYRTGKFCHIYAPYVTDADSRRFKCPQTIDGKQWRITLPDEARYPLVLDPTLGYTTEGGTMSGAYEYIYGTCHTMPSETGTVTSFGFYCSSVKTGQYGFKFAVVNTDQSCESEGLTTVDQIEVDVPSTGLHDELGTPAGGTLVADTEYYICYTAEHDNNRTWYDSNGSYARYGNADIVYADEFPVSPATWPARASTATRQVSIWVNYSVAGAEGGQVIMITSY